MINCPNCLSGTKINNTLDASLNYNVLKQLLTYSNFGSFSLFLS